MGFIIIRKGQPYTFYKVQSPIDILRTFAYILIYLETHHSSYTQYWFLLLLIFVLLLLNSSNLSINKCVITFLYKYDFYLSFYYLFIFIRHIYLN